MTADPDSVAQQSVSGSNGATAYLRALIVAAGLSVAGGMSALAGEPVGDAEIGRRIYLEGILHDGTPLKGTRWDEIIVSGPQAACALCHRPSGMGAVEGDIPAPPVTGQALYGERGDVVAIMDPRSGKAFNQTRPAYTDESLAKALREGRHADGREMHVMMPRYRLGDADMQSLLAYLRQLSAQWSPGVASDLIRFATVITPGVDAERRGVFKEMVRRAVQQKNASTAVAGRDRARRHMAGAAEFVLGTERRWAIEFWELQGPPQTWASQLDEAYRKQPVFALVSGLGADTWEPVADFCDRRQMPCWFPSVDLPPAGEPRYTIYFTRGVALEAQVLASHMRDMGRKAPKRVVQVYRDDYVGAGAARVLREALAGTGIAVEDKPLAGDTATGLSQAMRRLAATDAVMLWLRPADLAPLSDLPPPAARVYVSAQLADVDRAPLPAAWKSALRVVYPYELPQRRQANLAYFKDWLTRQRLPLIDEPMQSEVYFSLAFLTDTVTEMLDNLYRDYLIERAENMISRREGGKVEAEFYASTQSKLRRPGPGAAIPESQSALMRAGLGQGKREGTTAYPRLGLGPGQRFASKGGYIARYAAGDTLESESGWIVP